MPIALANSAEPIPEFIKLGYAMYALMQMGLPQNQVDNQVLDKAYHAYRASLRRWERKQHTPRNLTMEQASHNFEQTVKWVMDAIGHQRTWNGNARDIADALSAQNSRVTPAHVRQAQDRIRSKHQKPKHMNHNAPGESRHDKPAQADFKREAV